MRERLYRVIFESDTPAGRAFDLALIAAILVSLVVVVLDSLSGLSARYDPPLAAAEWFFTVLFTLEYAARLYCAPQRLRYATSFFGLIDLLAILPTYLALFFPELHALIDVRALRLLRIFRILKLTQYLAEFRYLGRALAASRRKILVFLMTVSMVVLIMGTVMYVVEGPEHGFTSIPIGVYWAITTMTTVGFGDITPKTDFGRFIASLMMLTGWGVLAVPTGIVTAEMVSQRGRPTGWGVAPLAEGVTHSGDPGRGNDSTGNGAGLALAPDLRDCPRCGREGLGWQDRFCRQCGERLP